MSKLASIEVISDIIKHPNADSLSIASVLGYKCIIKNDSFKIGDKIVFIQPDCVLPNAEWSATYKAKSSRTKAIKLRNIWSQGIVESLDRLNLSYKWDIGDEVSDIIGISKYNPPQPQDLSAKGSIPFGIPKTDEERWENLDVIPFGETVDVTLKIDGQSFSAYCKLNEDKTISEGVLGRTMEYKLDCSNNYTRNEKQYDLLDRLRAYCLKHNKSICLRGESYGVGIQSLHNNPHSKMPLGLAIFSTYLIDDHAYARKDSPYYFRAVAGDLYVPTVDILEENVILTKELIKKYSEDLTQIHDTPFEGVVINGKDFTFKIINQSYD